MNTKKTEWFSKIVSKIILFIIYIYKYVFSKHVKWKFPFFLWEFSRILAGLQIFLGKKNPPQPPPFSTPPPWQQSSCVACASPFQASTNGEKPAVLGVCNGLPAWAARFATCFLLSCYFWVACFLLAKLLYKFLKLNDFLRGMFFNGTLPPKLFTTNRPSFNLTCEKILG